MDPDAPIDRLPRVGRKTKEALGRIGIRTVRELATAQPGELADTGILRSTFEGLVARARDAMGPAAPTAERAGGSAVAPTREEDTDAQCPVDQSSGDAADGTGADDCERDAPENVAVHGHTWYETPVRLPYMPAFIESAQVVQGVVFELLVDMAGYVGVKCFCDAPPDGSGPALYVSVSPQMIAHYNPGLPRLRVRLRADDARVLMLSRSATVRLTEAVRESNAILSAE